ncbi:hypothetical protein ACIGMX_34975 [Streptomyces aquilus]|uniref:hypothetical protein n=1 Tax=Streptomyces aquilus TaxID=2548456 RepID=UPI0037CF247E
MADELRRNPGTWTVLGEWRSLDGARLTARRIRNGYQVYAPKGAYEARAEATETGARVVARYVGEPPSRTKSQQPATPRVPSAPDGESARILDRIRRGEVLAGPEGARQIAAQHEAAYGAIVWAETNDDDAWAEAIAALSEDGAE